MNSPSFYQLYSIPMLKPTTPSTPKPPFTTPTVCTTPSSPKAIQTPEPIPQDLSFAPQALFFALEAIVAHPAPPSTLTQTLRKMLIELDQHQIHGYFRLKAYMLSHSAIVREVRKVQREKGLGRYERYCAGVRLLVDGITFRDLAKAYFEVVEEVDQGVEKQKKECVVVDTEKAVLGASEKQERCREEYSKELPEVGIDEKGKYYPFKWVWDEAFRHYIIVKDVVTEKDTKMGTQGDMDKD